MRLPTLRQLYAVTEATWPAAAQHRLGPWTIRRGDGAGSRVSAATAEAPVTGADIVEAAAAMRVLGQPALFQVREGDDALDALLAAAGYAIKDPVNIYAAPVAALTTERPPPVTSFAVWPPLAAQADIWAAAGIGAARLAVMDRAPGPKTTLLGRRADAPAGTAYVGIHDGIAMLHALEVAPAHRRHGLARHLLRGAAFWAADNGASTMSLIVTQANTGANVLYASLGMTLVGKYHYRILTE